MYKVVMLMIQISILFGKFMADLYNPNWVPDRFNWLHAPILEQTSDSWLVEYPSLRNPDRFGLSGNKINEEPYICCWRERDKVVSDGKHTVILTVNLILKKKGGKVAIKVDWDSRDEIDPRGPEKLLLDAREKFEEFLSSQRYSSQLEHITSLQKFSSRAMYRNRADGATGLTVRNCKVKDREQGIRVLILLMNSFDYVMRNWNGLH